MIVCIRYNKDKYLNYIECSCNGGDSYLDADMGITLIGWNRSSMTTHTVPVLAMSALSSGR